jgi:hypothetical protein
MIKQQEINTINRIINSLKDYALGDIRKSINLTGENNMHIGSFILCSCFIDQVSAFYYGMKTLKILRGKNNDPIYVFNVKQRFEQFCDDYLKKINTKYNSNHLYNDFRCKIVHNYSSGRNSFALGRIGSGNHLEKLNSGAVLLLVETFYDDIKKAFEKWCDDLFTKEEIRKNAIEWFDLFKIYELII